MSHWLPDDPVDCIVSFKGDPLRVQYRISATLHHSTGRLMNLRGDHINIITNVPERVLDLVSLPFKPITGAVYKTNDGGLWVYCLDSKFRRLSYIHNDPKTQEQLIEMYGTPDRLLST